MPLLSWTFAGETVIASGNPYLSTARWILMPLIFLLPSQPRRKQAGAARQERLSTMTALGSGVSPQACRHVWIKRLSSRRHRPSRVHRANSVYSVPNGIAGQSPATACRKSRRTRSPCCAGLLRPMAASARAVLPSCPPWPRQHRVNEGVDVTESIPRGQRSLGGCKGGAHMLLVRWLLATAVDIAHRPPARQLSFTSK